jgi:hypothetical protein
MSEHTGRNPDQAGDQDNDSDKDSDNDPGAAPSRQRQAERQAEQESALQQWETEGGAEEDADTGQTPDSVQDDAPPDSGRVRKEQEAN